MLVWIQNDPAKLGLFIATFFLLFAYVFLHFRNPRHLFWCAVFYLPLSFKSNSGTLSMYLFVLIYLLFLYGKGFKFQYRSNSQIPLVWAILICSSLSLFNGGLLNLFASGGSSLGIHPDYLYILIMFSNLAIYSMVIVFCRSREAFVGLIKVIVISGFVASFAAYVQLAGLGKEWLFKYIIIKDSEEGRVSGTMAGYELFSEYTGMLIGLCLLLFFLTSRRLAKLVYLVVIINFIIVLTFAQTRGIYISMCASLVYCFILLSLLGRFQSAIKIGVYGVLAIILLISAILTVDYFRPEKQFMDRWRMLTEKVNIKEREYGTRTGAWAFGIESIGRMTTAEKALGAGNKYLSRYERGLRVGTEWPHCLYMAYALRDGFLGLALLLGFLGFVYILSLKAVIAAKSFGERDAYLMSLVLHVVLIVFLIDETKIEFIRHDRMQNFVWLVLGVIVANANMILNRSPEYSGGGSEVAVGKTENFGTIAGGRDCRCAHAQNPK